MERRITRALWVAILAVAPVAGIAATASPAVAQAALAERVLAERCAECHTRRPDASWSRIGDMRKTPEGWDMTLVRMSVWHGVALGPAERGALVKHLADRQGLAPEEAAPYRYILERRPNVPDRVEDESLQQMCARCHTMARVGLQRRDADEWLKLAHTHLGQWPTIEYQAMGRDRNWWEIARTEIPKTLGRLFPLKTPAWDAWARRPKPDVSGTWRIVGHRPGIGAYQGTATVSRSREDLYVVYYDLGYADGTRVSGTGEAIVYTGYEWRGSTRLGKEIIREVFAVSADGNALAGRWFLAESDEVGADLRAVRVRGGHAEVLAVTPSYLRAGETARVTIHGTGLSGAVDLGDGVEVSAPVEATAEHVTVRARARPDAASGPRPVRVGGTAAGGLFAVYRQIDSVRVEPEFGIARVGGGPVPPVTAQFEAVAYLNGPDGQPSTADDVRIGVVPATWTVDNFNDLAKALEDAKHVGAMQPGGLFVPAVAGPNPARKFQTNNAGDLAVRATVTDGGRTLAATGHLIVTVQRWNDPPIR